MTERSELQKAMVAKLREHADFLKHNVATWQLLARAADEIERLQADATEWNALRELAADTRVSSELIGIRVRNTIHQQTKLPPMCDGCGVNRADPPSKLCPGCQAYRDHQR